MNPFYVCDRSNYVRFGNDKIHSCGRHDVLTAEGTCCPGTLKPAFYADDLVKMLNDRKKYLYAMVEKYKRNNLEDQYDAAAHEIETILKELTI